MDAIAGSDPVTAARIGYVPRRPLPPSGTRKEGVLYVLDSHGRM